MKRREREKRKKGSEEDYYSTNDKRLNVRDHQLYVYIIRVHACT